MLVKHFVFALKREMWVVFLKLYFERYTKLFVVSLYKFPYVGKFVVP